MTKQIGIYSKNKELHLTLHLGDFVDALIQSNLQPFTHGGRVNNAGWQQAHQEQLGLGALLRKVSTLNS